MTSIDTYIAWLKGVCQKLVNAVRAGWRRPEVRDAREVVWKHFMQAMVAAGDELWARFKEAKVPTPEGPLRAAA